MSYDPSEEPELFGRIEDSLQGDSPLEFLYGASNLLAQAEEAEYPQLVGEGEIPLVTAETLVDALLDKPHAVTDTLIYAWATILADPELHQVVEEQVRPRLQVLPAWLAEIHRMVPKRVLSMDTVFQEDRWLAVETVGPRGGFTLMVKIQMLGVPFIEDAYMTSATADDLLVEFERVGTDNMSMSEIDLADARVILESALEMTTKMFPPIETETWPQTKPLLEWQMRKMPEGDGKSTLSNWEPWDIQRLAREFLASPEAIAIPTQGVNVAGVLLDLSYNYGPGDPRQIGPVLAERLLLDLVPRKIMFAEADMLAVPSTLSAIVAFGHRQLGIDPYLSDLVQETIMNGAAEYADLVMGEEPGTDWTASTDFQNEFDELLRDLAEHEGIPSFIPTVAERKANTELDRSPTKILLDQVGGADGREKLNDAALPLDEPLSLTGVPEDIQPRVISVGYLVEQQVPQFFPDPEMRTAALRTLHHVAVSNPEVFRRRYSDKITAGTIAWITARNNKWFDRDNPERTQRHFMAAFKLKSSPRYRAEEFLRPLGVKIYTDNGHAALDLGRVDMLTAKTRSELMGKFEELGL